jgi:hypothetical protein
MNTDQLVKRSAVICTPEVRVTVTTVRYDEPDGEPAWQREATAEGTFEAALQHALAERLHDRALHQVFGKVLARRPAPGAAIEYERMFSPLRHLLIVVVPAGFDAASIEIPLVSLDEQ